MHDSCSRPDAIACLRGGPDAPGLTGEARFYQQRGSVLVTVRVSGLPQGGTGFFALHVHEGPACTGEYFSDTGGHFNPTNALHPEHAGDLPALLRCGGGAWLAVQTDRFCVRDVIGRTVVIHQGPDDLHSQPAGNSGTKMACGVIRRV